MTTEQIQELKAAANHFYLDMPIDNEMSDLVYDHLRAEYEYETGKSVKTLVDWDSDLKFIHEPCEPLDKDQIEDNDLQAAVEWYFDSIGIRKDYTLNYKYDGSSIKAYYENGRLKSILGTPDEEYGIVRTKGFWNMFPHEVPKDIKSIQGEVLVDANVYGELARNKANGITNSKYKDDEIESEAFIRVYKLNYHDGDWSLDRQENSWNSIKAIERDRLRLDQNGSVSLHHDIVFCVAQDLSTNQCPKSSIITESINLNGLDYVVKFQVDGVVAYTHVGLKGFKFYFTEFQDTEVEEVQWNRKANGSFAPVLAIKTIELNGKEINNVATGGVPNMIDNQMGKGAKVRVILANMTIPKVIKVLEPSEDYQYPTCECGHQFTENDIFGSTLKCTNESPCSWKVTNWYKQFIGEILETPDCINKSVPEFFKTELWWILTYLKIDRWNPESKYQGNNTRELASLLLHWVDLDMLDKFKALILDNFYFTELNEANFEINCASTFEVLKKFTREYNLINQDYYEQLFEND